MSDNISKIEKIETRSAAVGGSDQNAENGVVANGFEPETNENVDVYVHIFGTPFEWEEKTYNKLVFNFGKLTGADADAIESELQMLGKVVFTAEMSGAYLIRMAARACEEKLGSDAFAKMSLKDYNKIRNRARSFLLRSAS